MAHRIFVFHLGQGEASVAYSYSAATENKARQIVKKSLQTEAATETKVVRTSTPSLPSCCYSQSQCARVLRLKKKYFIYHPQFTVGSKNN